MSDLREMMDAVREVFMGAECMGYNCEKGFCIYWPTDISPIIATGQHPRKAWRNAYKLVKGKNKKALEKLKKSLLEQEVKKGGYGPGA